MDTPVFKPSGEGVVVALPMPAFERIILESESDVTGDSVLKAPLQPQGRTRKALEAGPGSSDPMITEPKSDKAIGQKDASLPKPKHQQIVPPKQSPLYSTEKISEMDESEQPSFTVEEQETQIIKIKKREIEIKSLKISLDMPHPDKLFKNDEERAIAREELEENMTRREFKLESVLEQSKPRQLDDSKSSESFVRKVNKFNAAEDEQKGQSFGARS